MAKAIKDSLVWQCNQRYRGKRLPSLAARFDRASRLRRARTVAAPCDEIQRGANMLLLILTIVLILALFGSLPTWPHSREWGYYPSGGIGLILVILLLLILMGRL